jgi:hypothetical protein
MSNTFISLETLTVEQARLVLEVVDTAVAVNCKKGIYNLSRDEWERTVSLMTASTKIAHAIMAETGGDAPQAEWPKIPIEGCAS